MKTWTLFENKETFENMDTHKILLKYGLNKNKNLGIKILHVSQIIHYYEGCILKKKSCIAIGCS